MKRILRGFLVWWCDELLSLIPARLRSLISPSEIAANVTLTEDRIIVQVNARHRNSRVVEVPLAEWDAASPDRPNETSSIFSRRARDIAIRVPDEWVLTRDLSLPQAAKADLRGATTFQIETNSPFAAEEVYFDVVPIRDEPANGSVSVRLYILPKYRLAPLFPRLRQLGYRATQVRCAPASDPRAGNVDFLAGASSTKAGRMWPAMAGVSVLIAALSISGSVLVQIADRKARLHNLTEQVASLSKAYRENLALETKLADLKKHSTYLAIKNSERLRAIDVLQQLTVLLPDDTSLYQLQISGPNVEIQGHSTTAPALPGLIEPHPLFAKARFRSRLSQDQATGKDRFRLTFELAKGLPK